MNIRNSGGYRELRTFQTSPRDPMRRAMKTMAILILTAMIARGAEGPDPMAPIPAGVFRMGDASTEGWPDERPVRRVALSAFHMDRWEVTNADVCELFQWALEQGAIVADAGSVSNRQGAAQTLLQLDDWNCEIVFEEGRFAPLPGRERFPCVEITWYGALAYAHFRSQREGLGSGIRFEHWSCDFASEGYRLPTEAEWEYAARGGLVGQHFPWPSPPRRPSADFMAGHQANYWGSGDPWEAEEVTRSSPVGYYDGGQQPAGADMANGYGLYDMAGNVYEWCWDGYDSEGYQRVPVPGPNPTGPPNAPQRVVRGGSWLSGSREAERGESATRGPGYYLRCANRSAADPDNGRHNRGFRCVRRRRTSMSATSNSRY